MDHPKGSETTASRAVATLRGDRGRRLAAESRRIDTTRVYLCHKRAFIKGLELLQKALKELPSACKRVDKGF